ncbi:uroporphyrinogen-III synthase [Sanguibacter sp. 4.1]|uniref:Uroporphyrinogen-III synthase n=1 Tax=Sanguibacter biliveldensis TaxID=3030830 RepID=A0AAF0Z8K0_9MICO|nr:uroporphyrinogen-III synthase [Sanguibacter sp. 4.1]WPF82476.1 uroporphyrinogen-III synthase [Sanguibacter sp. 4.1]
MNAADDTSGVTEFSNDQLSGFRIGVTSDRRSDDLIAALERRGAQVMHAPALRIAPVEEDVDLLADTRAILETPPDVLVVTTAYGMRRWSEAADAAGLGDALTDVLQAARIFVRGPKARGAVRAAGLDDVGIAHDERTASVIDMLLDEGVEGRTVAVQLHGYTDGQQLERLRAGGARVLTVEPYRWVKPDGVERLPRLIDAVCARNLDVVTFTSAPAVDAFLTSAIEQGVLDQLLDALRTDVVAAAVGPVTAGPLEVAGVTPIIPERFRMGALIRLVCEHLALHQVTELSTALGPVQIRGRSVVFEGRAGQLAPAPLALFRALAASTGAVLTRKDLMAHLPEAQNEHALDMAMSRLRASLPEPRLVATVVKRGYRLNV